MRGPRLTRARPGGVGRRADSRPVRDSRDEFPPLPVNVTRANVGPAAYADRADDVFQTLAAGGCPSNVETVSF
ncbi:hypothetical protein GCM10017600_56980 [Streptosporangium carneum]|uniref:Uncharacterized protein n=1 Tax=Streptosporangium carneum TaxID=47481 RepID=A0A9W6I7D4_9ACTN|nr:hypothetical protein GCM10017600_56980 [Streptosporangium carneum]